MKAQLVLHKVIEDLLFLVVYPWCKKILSRYLIHTLQANSLTLDLQPFIFLRFYLQSLWQGIIWLILKVLLQQLCRPKSFPRIFLKHIQQKLIQTSRVLFNILRCHCYNVLPKTDDIFPLKGMGKCCHMIANTPQAPNISLIIVLLILDDLWC